MRSTLQTKMIGTIELSIVMVMGTKNYNSSIVGPEKRPFLEAHPLIGTLQESLNKNEHGRASRSKINAKLFA